MVDVVVGFVVDVIDVLDVPDVLLAAVLLLVFPVVWKVVLVTGFVATVVWALFVVIVALLVITVVPAVVERVQVHL